MVAESTLYSVLATLVITLQKYMTKSNLVSVLSASSPRLKKPYLLHPPSLASLFPKSTTIFLKHPVYRIMSN